MLKKFSPTNKSQPDKFKAMAKKFGVNESEKAFDEKLKKIAKKDKK